MKSRILTSNRDPNPGSGPFLPDPESSPPDPDPDLDLALVMYIYQVIISKKTF